MDMSGTGFIRVRVSAANGALPVSGASVIIIEDLEGGESGNITATLVTDTSGLTPTVSVSAPPKSYSLSPTSGGKPYSTVNISISADGYYPVENVGVPVFDGTVSQQNVNLLPISDDGKYPREGLIVNEGNGGTLFGGDR